MRKRLLFCDVGYVMAIFIPLCQTSRLASRVQVAIFVQ